MSSPHNAPIGVQRLWREEFIEDLAKKVSQPLRWVFVGPVNKINIQVKVPNKSGVYFFVRRSIIENLSPFERYPLIVYIGLSNDLRQRLLDYVKDKQVALRYTESNTKIRAGVRMMFRAYRDSLDLYIMEYDASDLIAAEDALIKIFDPIFNEKQRMPAIIEESEEPLMAYYGPPQSAYVTRSEVKIVSCLEVSIGDPQSPF